MALSGEVAPARTAAPSTRNPMIMAANGYAATRLTKFAEVFLPKWLREWEATRGLRASGLGGPGLRVCRGCREVSEVQSLQGSRVLGVLGLCLGLRAKGIRV